MKKSKGVTLIELLVVIAILAILSVIGLNVYAYVTENARVTQIISHIGELRKIVAMYYYNTGTLPPTCMLNCTALTDPFLTVPVGVNSWTGPYLKNDVGFFNLKHPWGGHIGIETGTFDDRLPPGVPITMILLDDDAPGKLDSDNSGVIPLSAMLKIDKALDDGVLSTGNVRGNPGDGTDACLRYFCCATNEMGIKVDMEE